MFSVFSTMKVSDSLWYLTAKPFDKVPEMVRVEGIIVGDVMAFFELFFRTFFFWAIGKCDKAIVFMQTAFMNDSHCPHKSAITPAAKTLAASHFHFTDRPGRSFEDEGATAIFKSFQR